MQAVRKSFLACLIFFLGSSLALASITGTISGIVTDASGSVIPGVTVTAVAVATGIRSVVQTDGKGFYSFPDLAVGTYNVTAEQKGFKTYEKDSIIIDANSNIRVDIPLEVGAVAERVTVSSDVVQVETQSTQMGEVITGERMTAVPLNGRDFTDLLDLQPGVVPNAYSSQAPGLGDRVVGGDTQGVNSGTQSINGQRETSNGFMVNGANVEEGKNNGTSVIPNLDSIAEFRIITNNFDAEYGNYSGGQVNVVTKQGTNSFHGDAFEFNRNTDFNARNYYATSIPKFIQNQFGGTFGGPIRKDSTFFFADYQGTRQINGPTQTTYVPDGTFDNSGNYDLSATQQTDLNNAAAQGTIGSVGGSNFATILSNRLGYAVNPGEDYFYATSSGGACTTTNPTTGCVFPNFVIPQPAFSSAAVGLMPYIPQPNVSAGFFATTGFDYSTSAFNNHLRDDKVGLRIDQNTRWGMLSAYYHGDDDTVNSPFPSGGANVASPNIGAYSGLNKTRAQLWMLSDTKGFGSTAVNEARIAYVRNAAHLFTPEGGLSNNGTPITLTGLGFPAPCQVGASGCLNPGLQAAGTFNGGIAPVAPALEGVPNIGFNDFTIGVPSDSTKQYNNMFQGQDNFTKVVGTHSLKFGAQFHYDQINDRNFYGENGSFSFDGSETGLDFADFLVGAPDGFIQATEQLLDTRSKYFGAYGQDSWRITPNLTLNYGLRWEFSNPWYDTGNKLETIIPGVQSVVFPGAPLGYLVPGDPDTPGGAAGGVPRTLASTRYHNFSPRLGIAYSPGADSGFLAKLTGGPGKTSIRAGYGIFYSAIEDLTQFQEIGDAPYGLFYVDPVPPLFEAPYIDRGTGNNEGQRFPFTFPPRGVSSKNPDSTFNWAGVEPIIGALAYYRGNDLPYAEDYEFSIQRQFGSNTVASISYVGTQAHHLLTELESNPGNQQLCLELAAEGCGPFGEANAYTLPPGAPYPAAATPGVETTGPCTPPASGTCNVINTTYTVIPPENGVLGLGNDPYEITAAQSSYNSLQASIRQSTSFGSFLLGYTYSKCRDDASGLQEGVNPFDPKASTALCIFDVTHNFTGSYDMKLPLDRLFHADSDWANRVAGGWSLSGITTFATGLPVVISERDDNSLTGTINTEAPIDEPEFTPGKILNDTNPRHGNTYFNTSLFSFETIGQIGNAKRRFFHGPGLNNWDFALLKDTKFTESKSLQFRAEAFNIFNHAQFSNPDGTINDGTFGLVGGAYAPRILQIALKFLF